jgi:hypothetical protein
LPAQLDALLSTRDNFEVVRDQIAAILKLELVHQGELGLTPVPRVFVERSSPWGPLVESPINLTPIINVWFDTETFDGAASNIVSRQRADGTFNVDAYGFGMSTEAGPGHEPGDLAAAFACQKTLRLVRQILMSAPYTYLGLRGLVGKRWPQTLGVFQPPIDARAAHHVVAGRLALAVQFNEFGPEIEAAVIETLAVEVFRETTGEVYLAARYPSEGNPP